MPEPLIKVVLFTEWETLFDTASPGDNLRKAYRQLSSRGLHTVLISDQQPEKLFKWCGKQHFPDAILSERGLSAYRGRNLQYATSSDDAEAGLEGAIRRYFRLADMEDDILIKCALLHTHVRSLSPLMDLVALDKRAEEPQVPPNELAVYRCSASGEAAFIEWAGAMSQRLNVMFRKKKQK